MFEELVLLLQQGQPLEPARAAAPSTWCSPTSGPPRCSPPRCCARPRAARCAPSRAARSATSTPSATTSSPSASARPARARAGWRWRWPCRRCRRKRGRAHHPHPAGGRGGGAARLPARRPHGQGRPVPAPALRRPLRHGRARGRAAPPRARNVVEVAPLAFMRGRAQPVDRRVLTPVGVAADRRRSRSATSSSGPTACRRRCSASSRRVAGGLPGRAPRTAASTLACAEHLWSVTTLDDQKHGKAGRVAADPGHGRPPAPPPPAPVRAPAAQRPAQFEAQDGPDGPRTRSGSCSATAASPRRPRRRSRPPTPSWSIALEAAARRRRAGREVRASTTCCGTGRMSGEAARPTRSPRAPRARARGTDSATKFVPLEYLFNSPDVRLAAAAGPARQRRRTGHPGGDGAAASSTRRARAQLRRRRRVPRPVARRRRLRPDPARPKVARRAWPGVGRSTTAATRTSSTSACPRASSPFRLARKAAKYDLYGAGRPMRIIDASSQRARPRPSASRWAPPTRSTSPTTSSSPTTR